VLRACVSVLSAIAITLALSACYPAPVVDAGRTSLYVRQITLYGRPIDVHFARPRAVLPLRPMLLYATGDGGFHGNDEAIFDALASFGYPVAGFSARNYLKNLGYVADTTTPQRLAADYRELIQFSKKSLMLPDATPVILVGVSRGAGLAVVAAGQPMVRGELAGVLAIALTREEEYVRHYLVHRGALPPGTPRRELVMIQTYEYLPRLSSLRVSVVQSTGDSYLPADKARELFGPDTSDRQLHAIDAWDHSFRGAREELYKQMEQSLDWISSALMPTTLGPGH
jgi:hypothetical protein